MSNPHIKVNLCIKASLTIHLNGKYFFGETQRRLSGEWKVNIRDNKLFFENSEQILMADTKVVISPISVDGGFQITQKLYDNELTTKCTTYKGDLILNKDRDVVVVSNQVDIESFVKNILCHQFPDCRLLEFLKVQALILRSSILQLSRNEDLLSLSNEAFIKGVKTSSALSFNHLFLDNSQLNLINLYQGFPSRCNDISHRAVDETMGMILVYNDEICHLPQTVSCGGITDASNKHDSLTSIGVLKRTNDSKQPTDIDLSQQQDLENWIYNPVECYCNTDGHKMANQIMSINQDQDLNLFRWNDVIDGVKISSVLRNRLNLNIGKISEVDVVERSNAGVCKLISIIGDSGQVQLKGVELLKFILGINIQSPVFLIEKNNSISKDSVSFTLNGAGTGMITGLCQLGALKLASEGVSAIEILNHYFNAIYTEKQY